MNLEKILNATIKELEEACMHETLPEYINDCLEVEYTMNLWGVLRGVELLVSSGGPNVFINTRTAKVDGYENGNHLEMDLPFDVLQEIEDYIISMI